MLVEAAEQGVQGVEAGTERVMHSREVVHAMVQGAGGIAEAAAQIAATSQQELVGMEQLSQAIGSTNEASNQSAVATRQVEDEAKHLQELAVELRQLVETKAGAPGTGN